MSVKSILAIETATPACSIALGLKEGGRTEVFSRCEIGANIHSQKLLEMVNTLLLDNNISCKELDAIAVGQGPGSFTGLRIGVGVAQGLAYGCHIPMIGVSSLAALALRSPSDGSVIAGIDARMGQIYWAEYSKQKEQLSVVSESQVSEPSAVSGSIPNPVLVGNAWAVYENELPKELVQGAAASSNIEYPQADEILPLAWLKFAQGEFVPAMEFTPHYVRNDVAKKSLKRPY